LINPGLTVNCFARLFLIVNVNEFFYSNIFPGVGFALLSYLGYLNIRVLGCKSLFPEESELKDLLKEIELEFYRLRDSAQV